MMVKNTMPSPWSLNSSYRYEYANEVGMFRVWAVWSIEQWIESQDQSLWIYDHDEDPRYGRAIFLLEPKLMTLLKLKWAPADVSYN